MAYTIRRADYYHTTIDDEPGEAYRVLSQLASQGINLLAFTGMPVGPMRTQFTLFPEDGAIVGEAARRAG